MPADHLTIHRPSESADIGAAVSAVLGGAAPETVAVEHALHPFDLEDAVRTYQAAGLAALQRRTERTWHEVRIQFPDWSAAEQVGATRLGPVLDGLRDDETIAGWWFLRKYPCWRLRLLRADAPAVNRILDELTRTGAIEQWWPTIYEPETAAFGGPAAMAAIHDLFCADTTGVLTYLRHATRGLGRRELSLLLLNGLMRAAGLDTFETGDVFDRIARLRPAPANTGADRIDTLADNVRSLLSIPDPGGTALFAPNGPAAHAAPWLAALRTTGERLGHGAATGHLDRGLRAILTHVVIFHWNRFGLSATTQAILANAATTALLPRS